MLRTKRYLPLIFAASMLLASSLNAVQDKKDVLIPANANEARLNRLQPPDQVMDAIGVKAGMTVAEIGAGQGRYVVQLAVRVGENGQVYAEDINQRSLNFLEDRCKRGKLKNVTAILGDVTDPKLPKNALDLIFIISAYHHFDDPIALLRKARLALKPNGVVAIGEWLPEDEGDPESRTPKKIEEEMNKAGYKLERIEKFLEKNNMYIYIFSAKD